MRHPATTALAAFAALATLAACQDDRIAAPVVDDGDGEALLTGVVDPEKGSVHAGYVLGNDGETPVRIGYQVVNGHAIHDGDVGLGPADRIAKTPEELLRRHRAGEDGPSLSLHATGASYWSDTGGVIPVRQNFSPTNLSSAMAQIESQVPGIDFVPYNGQGHYIAIHYGSGSNYYNGCYGGRCDVYIGSTGASKALIMHELGHALGFQHEHKRCDRNSYLNMINTNPDPSQFSIRCDWDERGGYDMSSIMHYNSYEFGVLHFTDWNGHAVQGYWGRTTLSPGDVSSWRSLYPGSSGSSTYPVIWSGPYPTRVGPNTGYSTSQWISSGTQVQLACSTRGGSEIGPDNQPTDLWYRLGGAHSGTWISDAHLNTGTFSAVVGTCATVQATGTIIDALNVRTGPGLGYSVVGTVAKDTYVGILCTARGSSVTGPYGTTDLWNKLDSGYYVSDAYVYTGSSAAVAPSC